LPLNETIANRIKLYTILIKPKTVLNGKKNPYCTVIPNDFRWPNKKKTKRYVNIQMQALQYTFCVKPFDGY